MNFNKINMEVVAKTVKLHFLLSIYSKFSLGKRTSKKH